MAAVPFAFSGKHKIIVLHRDFSGQLHFFSFFSCTYQKIVVTLQSQMLQRPSGAPTRNEVPYGESEAPEYFNKPRVYGGFGPCARVANASNFAVAFICEQCLNQNNI